MSQKQQKYMFKSDTFSISVEQALEGLSDCVEIVYVEKSTGIRKSYSPALEKRKKFAVLFSLMNTNLEEEDYHNAHCLLQKLWSWLNDLSDDNPYGIENKHRYAVCANLCYTALKTRQNPNFVEFMIKSLNFEPCLKFTYYLEIMYNFREGNFTIVISFVEKILKSKQSMLKSLNVNYFGVHLLDEDNIPELENQYMFLNIEILGLFAAMCEKDGKIEFKKQKHNAGVFGSVTKKHFQNFVEEFLRSVVGDGLQETEYYSDIRKKYSKDNKITKLKELFDNVDKKDKKTLINLLNTKSKLFHELISLIPKNSEIRQCFERATFEIKNRETGECGTVVICNMSIPEILHKCNLSEEIMEFIELEEMEKEMKTKQKKANKPQNSDNISSKKQFRDAKTDTSNLKNFKHKSLQTQPKTKSISIQTDMKKVIVSKKTIVDEKVLNKIVDIVQELKNNVTQKLNNKSIKELKEDIQQQKAKFNIETQNTEKTCEELTQIIDTQKKENDVLIYKIKKIKRNQLTDQNFIERLKGVKNQQIQEKYTIQMMELNRRERQCDFILDYFQSYELFYHTKTYREYWKNEYDKMINCRTQLMTYFQKTVNEGHTIENWPSFPTIDMKEFYKYFQDTAIIFTLFNQFRMLEKNKTNDNFKNIRLISGDNSKEPLVKYLRTHVRQDADTLDIFRSLNRILEENRNSDLNYHDILVYVQTYITDIDNSCTICFEEYTENNFYIMKCKHKFHLHCIKQWMEKSKCCPICRREERDFKK